MSKSDISETYSVELGTEEGIRADRYISDNLKLFSRSQIKNRNLIITLKNKTVKPGKYLFNGDIIKLEYNFPESLNLTPENIGLNIIYEDKDVVVINKPQGLVVHPGAGNFKGTLVHGLLYHYNELKKSFAESDLRPGIVHRLDKDTSGVIIAAKNIESLEFLSSQFRDKSTVKIYLAIVKGVPVNSEGIIDTFIARDIYNRKKFTVTRERGKKAVTRYKVIEQWRSFSLLRLKPETGRTHQLRVHMLHLGNSILGDPVYGRISGKLSEATLMLHAYKLSIRLPLNPCDRVSFTAAVPERFIEIIEQQSADPVKTIELINGIRD